MGCTIALKGMKLEERAKNLQEKEETLRTTAVKVSLYLSDLACRLGIT